MIPNKIVIIPLKLVGLSGQRLINVIVDTGATYSMFSPDALLSIGCNVAKCDRTIKIITASSVEYVPFLRVPAVEFLGHKLENVPVVSHVLPEGTPADGLLGVNTLNRFNVHFDFLENQLSISA